LATLAALANGAAAGPAERAAAPARTDAQACPEPALEIRPMAPGVWWIPGAAGDSNATNRGAVSNLLAVRDGGRLWLLGSGPSLRYGHALACQLEQRSGLPVSDVIAPWARPELVLGQAALPTARRWAHADVARAMQERCPHCIERLRLRLGDAAHDLGDARVSLPDHLLHGDAGQLGPWRWWRLERSPATAVTIWALPRAGLATAHGLLWADGAPDLRDSEVGHFAAAAQALVALEHGEMTHTGSGPTPGAAPLWLPEQGPWQIGAPTALQHYVRGLLRAVQAAQDAGASETEVVATLPGVADGVTRSERHALNWQRAWREAEARSFGAPAR
jgi:hypothetical protein